MKIYVHDCGRAIKGIGGYPSLNREVIKQFINMGHEVLFDDIDPRHPRIVEMGDFQQYIENRAKFDPQEADFIITISPPYSFRPENFPGKIHIGWTTFEDDFIPGDRRNWIPIMNNMTAMATCCEWNNQMIKREGVNVPIFKIPATVDKSLFNDGKGDRFKILCVHESGGKTSSRERWQETIKWVNECLEGKYAELTIKTWNGSQSGVMSVYQGLDKTIPLVYHESLIPNEHMPDFYKQHHLFVKNTMREGLGVPAAEAIACGLKCLARPIPASMEIYMDGKANDFFENETEFKDSLLKHYEEWESQQFFRKRYEDVAQNILKIYEAVKNGQ